MCGETVIHPYLITILIWIVLFGFKVINAVEDIHSLMNAYLWNNKSNMTSYNFLSKPPPVVLKMNIDRSHINVGESLACGVILRDQYGAFMKGFYCELVRAVLFLQKLGLFAATFILLVTWV